MNKTKVILNTMLSWLVFLIFVIITLFVVQIPITLGDGKEETNWIVAMFGRDDEFQIWWEGLIASLVYRDEEFDAFALFFMIAVIMVMINVLVKFFKLRGDSYPIGTPARKGDEICYSIKDFEEFYKGKTSCNDDHKKWREKNIRNASLMHWICSGIYLVIISIFFLAYSKKYPLIWAYYALYAATHIVIEWYWHFKMMKGICHKCWIPYMWSSVEDKQYKSNSYTERRTYSDTRIGSIGSVGVYSRDWYTKKEAAYRIRRRYDCPLCSSFRYGKKTTRTERPYY